MSANPASPRAIMPSDAIQAEPEAYFDGLIDLVENGGQIEFLYLDAAGQPQHAPRVEIDGRWITPPARAQLPFPLVSLREVQQAMQDWTPSSARELFLDARAHIAQSVRLPEPDEDWLDLMGLWPFHTYIQELLRYSPIVLLEGAVGRGKTRLGKALTHLSYRGVHTPSARQASLYRFSELYHATLFLDISEFKALTRATEAEEIILSRFEKGLRVPRVNNPQAGRYKDIDFADLFGPTIIATNSRVVEAIRSRSIAPIMPEGSHVALGEASTAEETAALRARFLAFRASMLRQGTLPAAEKVAPGRLGDISMPLVQLMTLIAPERVDRLIAHIGGLEASSRNRRADTLEGQIVAALVALQSEVERGRLPVKRVTAWLSSNREGGYTVAPQLVGSTLQHLGVSTKKINGRAYVQYDHAQVAGLAGMWCADDHADDDEPPESDTVLRLVPRRPTGGPDRQQTADTVPGSQPPPTGEL